MLFVHFQKNLYVCTNGQVSVLAIVFLSVILVSVEMWEVPSWQNKGLAGVQQ